MSIIWLTLILLSILFVLSRALIGPTAANRAIALDTITTITTGLLVVISLMFSNIMLLDITFIYTVLSFGFILAIARYIEKGI
jgi:multicomponent Na+:H+ antiporter subunit F